jgi:hypothetical protein
MAKRSKKRCEELPILHPDAAGIDVGASELFVAVGADRDHQPVRSFTTFTRDLNALAEGGTDFVGQAHLDDLAGFAAFDQAQSAVGDERAHDPTGGVGGEASTAGEPGNGEAEAGPSRRLCRRR